MRIALAHDSFTQLGGAERLVDAFHELYPEAPIFTLVMDKSLEEKYRGWDIRTSWLQVLYNIFPKLQYFLFLIPAAVSSLNFSGYDVVLSSSSVFIKNINVPKGVVHINYCNTPARFLWSEPEYVNDEVPFLIRPLVKLFLKWMQSWDYDGAQRVDHFIANSTEVQNRILTVYGRTSTVIYPFADTQFWHATKHQSDYFLLAGRLQAHKKNELMMAVFNELNIPLHVVGTGRQENYLKSIAGQNISFLGRVTDERLRDEYSAAKGVIYPQIEDFGLVPLEAAACGTATLAFGRGGVLETIVPGQTGEFFNAYDKTMIKEMVRAWDPGKYLSNALLAQADKFTKDKFKQSIVSFVNEHSS